MASTTVVRTPHVVVEWREQRLVATDGATGRRHAVTVEALRVLDVAEAPATAADLAARAGVEPAVVVALLAARLLVPHDRVPERHYWSAAELVVQRTTRTARPAADREATRDLMEPPSKDTAGPSLELPVAEPADDPPFSQVLAERRSCRRFGDTPIDAATLGRFLEMACAVRQDARKFGSGVSWRPHPSGGGRHPLETYVYPLNVTGLEPAVYRYDPFLRHLEQVDKADESFFETVRNLHEHTELMEGDPAVLLVVTSVFGRTMWKYDNGGLLIVHQDVGALYQTFYLVATALGLGGCVIGGGSEALIAGALNIDPLREGHVGTFLLGVPADDRYRDPLRDVFAETL
ncbi:SagB/ThcOx family dehydrogenase [Actinomadura sp. KC06]|uniref:SagB family peptide dehydrogenase n=1 Tax=Actinomadura sp. KC06 TaxID=2530369 RepID=UPI00104BA89F|nr:SagB family peptide dehydrogenase [Actinomadura sp. KC06]TDD34673.1 SagB/ThcOx family dehydrogenase [Actinomadura sp. KC06]